ncbi:type 3 dihydrofolate reductase [Hydrogenovibrio marinus]|uniref:type 3 dihydrofolate reductase n=1 Tax=Hydrogenovibrio marinus TaxID=28885 RepID=UPI000A4BCBA2|nr:type 3 dihydrofolate reductase [Hydrogenovibrio marinus]BBN59115.1 dihydrofolate reductase [Hydrogenovibrio marinus]
MMEAGMDFDFSNCNLSMIAAMDLNRTIGIDNQMPWHLPDDLKFFKAKTLGKTVVMGRKTFESLGSRPLPKRRNLVITRNADYQAEGAEVFTSIEQALQSCQGEAEIIIMGGGELYRQMLPYANKLYVTRVQTTVPGDTVFPEWKDDEWQVVEKEWHDKDEKHEYAFDFVVLQKK